MDLDALFMGLALIALFIALAVLGKKPPGGGPKP